MDDEEFGDYANRVQALDDLRQTPQWYAYEDWLRNEQSKRARSILGGHLSPELYVRQCGFVEAIDLILSAAEVEKKRFAGVLEERE